MTSAADVRAEFGAGGKGSVRLAGINLSGDGTARARSVVLTKLKQLDKNGDGVIDAQELTNAVEEMMHQQGMRKVFQWVSVSALVVILVLAGAMAGIVYGIVELSKDTRVENNYFQTKDGQAMLVGVPTIKLSPTSEGGARRARSLLTTEVDLLFQGDWVASKRSAVCDKLEGVTFTLSVQDPDVLFIQVEGAQPPMKNIDVYVKGYSGCLPGATMKTPLIANLTLLNADPSLNDDGFMDCVDHVASRSKADYLCTVSKILYRVVSDECAMIEALSPVGSPRCLCKRSGDATSADCIAACKDTTLFTSPTDGQSKLTFAQIYVNDGLCPTQNTILPVRRALREGAVAAHADQL